MIHRALPLPADWPTRRAFVPQGCDQQGRLEPTIPPPAEACSEYLEDREPVPSLKAWALLCAPGAVMGVLMVLVLWATKP